MTFENNTNTRRDEQGVAKHLRHTQEPYEPPERTSITTPQALAHEYVREVAEVYELDPEWLDDLTTKAAGELTDAGVKIRYDGEKSTNDMSTVSYQQTVLGLPIWRAGLSVVVQADPLRVTSSTSTVHREVTPERIDEDTPFHPDQIEVESLSEALEIDGEEYEIGGINGARLLVYRFDADDRTESEPGEREEDRPLEGTPPTLSLAPLPDEITDGQHYVVTEVLFSMATPDQGELNWRVLIEPETGAVLYLRALVAYQNADVFERDPVTQTGNTQLTPCAGNQQLNPHRTTVNLRNLTAPNPGDPQALTGDYASVTNIANPSTAPPTESSGNFSYDVMTDDFGAACAYHNVTRFYRLMRHDLGFNLSNYFGQSYFPIQVDHAALGGAVNARADGNSMGNGLGSLQFGIAQQGCDTKMSTAWRVVLHEFGHALLWRHVEGPNFGFAHSAGDSLAAIRNDPGSQAPDRFQTFPWVAGGNIDRRHDRDVTAGWAWGGSQDTGGYSSEQILSTTLFRAYRSMGGDHSGRGMQAFASRYLTYLIMAAISTLTPQTPANNPDDFATALMNADESQTNFSQHPGGAFHKVIRWSFEKQGLYQPPSQTGQVTSPGDPPPVDVYINDGRNGEYSYLQRFWKTKDIWNRRNPDGGTAHETPVSNQTNYVYVDVKNRGTEKAEALRVEGYHCRPQAGLVWPSDWTPMQTKQRSPGDLPAGNTTQVGPFEWVPQTTGHACLLMTVSAQGSGDTSDDISNIGPTYTQNQSTISGPIPHNHLVPFDNNIAQRNVKPVSRGSSSLLDEFDPVRFWIKNPYDRPVEGSIEPVLPDLLREREWEVEFTSEARPRFELGPREEREVTVALDEGEAFDPRDVRQQDGSVSIEFDVMIDELLIGGMSYELGATVEESEPGIDEILGLLKRWLDELVDIFRRSSG